MSFLNDGITWPTLCIFGDSIVEGAGDETGQGWADRLKADWKVPREDGTTRPNVYDLGVDGDRTTDVLDRIESEAAARNARAIIVAVGVNDLPWADGRVATQADAFDDQYRQVLEYAHGVTENVIAISLLQVDESAGDHGLHNGDVQNLNTTIKRLCKQTKTSYLDLYELLQTTQLADGIHPNASGYETMYAAVKKELVRLGWDKLQ